MKDDVIKHNLMIFLAIKRMSSVGNLLAHLK